MVILDNRNVQDPHNNITKRGNNLMTLSNAYAKGFAEKQKAKEQGGLVQGEQLGQTLNAIELLVEQGYSVKRLEVIED